MAGHANDEATSVLARATRILQAFSEDHPELDLAQLTARSGLARSTAHRLATELVGLGLLDRHGGRYSVGTGLWEVGELSLVSLRLREVALPHLLELYAATGENVHLAVLAGHEALYVARLTGPASVPTLSRMGGRLPLHTTGVGRAILSTRDEAWLSEYFRRPREKETIHSVTDEVALRADLERCREVGFAVTRQEMTLGNVSLAAPLPSIHGQPPAAVGVVTHLNRSDQRNTAPLVVRAAADIGRDLSHWVG